MRQGPIFIRPIKLPWYAWVLIPLLLVLMLAAALFFLALFVLVFLPASILAGWITGNRRNRYLVPGARDGTQGSAFPGGFGPFVHVFWNFPGMGQASSHTPAEGKEIPGEMLIPSDSHPVDSSLLLSDGQTQTPTPPTNSQT